MSLSKNVSRCSSEQRSSRETTSGTAQFAKSISRRLSSYKSLELLLFLSYILKGSKDQVEFSRRSFRGSSTSRKNSTCKSSLSREKSRPTVLLHSPKSSRISTFLLRLVRIARVLTASNLLVLLLQLPTSPPLQVIEWSVRRYKRALRLRISH